MDKQELYSEIEKLRKNKAITWGPPYDAKVLCTTKFHLFFELLDIETPKLRGMAHIPSHSVVIDAKISPPEINFHCMHEIMHHVFHSDRPTKIYNTYDDTQANQDPFIEWQANEGAAQFLVPYQIFIPDYIKTARECAHNAFPDIDTEDFLSKKYFVSSKVIHNRIESLNYEIYQYLNGVPIETIDVRSKNYLQKNGWDLRHDKRYCKKCLAPLKNGDKYCKICGCFLDDGHFLHQLRTIGKGAGYMEYPGIELDEEDRALECPVCHNTELYSKGQFCIICGNSLVNLCSEAQESYSSSCQNTEPLPGNARYCPFCGSESTFLQRGILLHWDGTSEDPDDDVELPF